MGDKILRARGANGGVVKAEALVCPESIQGWAGIDDKTGVISEVGHSQKGKGIAGKIMVLPCSKGSNGWSCHFNSAMVYGYKPAGWVFTKLDSKGGVTATITDVPVVCDFTDADPCEAIQTGDIIEIDGTLGTVTIIERASK